MNGRENARLYREEDRDLIVNGEEWRRGWKEKEREGEREGNGEERGAYFFVSYTIRYRVLSNYIRVTYKWWTPKHTHGHANTHTRSEHSRIHVEASVPIHRNV